MKKFGELVIIEGFATEEQIRSALEYQRTSDIALGRVMVDLHIVTTEQKLEILEFLNNPEGKGKKFGEAAKELGFANDEDIYRALEFQKKTKGMLGDILIEMNIITVQQKDAILKIQSEYE